MAEEDFPKFPEFFAGMEIAQVSLSNAVSLVPMESDCLLQLLLSLLQQTASLTAATAQVKKRSYVVSCKLFLKPVARSLGAAASEANFAVISGIFYLQDLYLTNRLAPDILFYICI